MRVFQCPAVYRRYITEIIARAIVDAKTDEAKRAEASPDAHTLPGLPDSVLDPRATGRLLVLVGDVDNADAINDLLVDLARSVADDLVGHARRGLSVVRDDA